MLFLQRYERLYVLGSGSMGEVWLARDTHLDRKVAVKVVNSKLIGQANEQVANRALAREAQPASRLSHPNIVTVYDFAIEADDGTPIPFCHARSQRSQQPRAVASGCQTV